MIKFAIRDDDTSFWTKPEELEFVYKEIWSKGIPVSLGVIPFSVKSYFPEDRDKMYQGKELMPIGENTKLVEFLKEKIKENKISIMLHGFSHQYKAARNWKDKPVLATKGNLHALRRYKKGTKLRWYGEYVWKDYEQLKKETREGKEYLEDTLHTKITVFVPPSNDISKDGVRAVAENRLNISGTMRLSKFNRPLNIYSLKNYMLKLWWRLKYNNIYPYVMKYGIYKELCAYGLVSNVTLEGLLNYFKFCRNKNAPFVLATHHWEINKEKNLQRVFLGFINYVASLTRVDFYKVGDILC